MKFENRDFYDKLVFFAKEGKFYIYSSGIPNDTEVKEVPEKVVRSKTIVSV